MKIVYRSLQYETKARILTRLTKSHIILRKRIEEAVKSLNTISPSDNSLVTNFIELSKAARKAEHFTLSLPLQRAARL